MKKLKTFSSLLKYKLLVLRYKLLHFFPTLIKKITRKRLNHTIANKINNHISQQVDRHPKKNCIYIFQAQFFDSNGTNYFSGGAERYCRDLTALFLQQKFKVILIQCGNEKKDIWIKKQWGMTIVGIPANYNDYLKIIAKLKSSRLSIYSGYTHWGKQGDIHQPSILISHGVTWDTPHQNLDKKWLHQILQKFTHIVSVDTNTLSYLRSTFSRELTYDTKEFSYIPNYVDHQIYHPIEKKQNLTSQKIRICFPRRLSDERGYWLFAPLVPTILNKYQQVEVHFVGFAHGQKINNHLNGLLKKYKGRVKHSLIDQNKMQLIYQQSDISLIPTLYSEGTSLSCLEAMACKNTVIATNIGGLTNLIIDEFNGILVNPNASELLKAIYKVLDSPKLREQLSNNAVSVSKVFSKEKWIAKWNAQLNQILR
ncbi:glycosyltransferase family 4 protein [Microgenomates group bacterium]|nr:glycosyltransferase family 4 protein [Microgenomates group bacterium]